MQDLTITPLDKLPATIRTTVPGDKSISHRAAMFAALAEGTSKFENFSLGQDNLSTLAVLAQLGIPIQRELTTVEIVGKGIQGLQEPTNVLDCGNSGTTMRLMTGLLSAQSFFSVLTGDDSLRSRPMSRVIDPLNAYGAAIHGRSGNTRAPIAISPGSITAIEFDGKIASAQVKSCLILAALCSGQPASITEPILSRNHTETMLKHMGADITVVGTQINLPAQQPTLRPVTATIPSDPSSAAFYLAMHNQLSGEIPTVLNNPTRNGLASILKNAGVGINFTNSTIQFGENTSTLQWQRGDLSTPLCPTASEMVDALDEFPLLCVIAATSPGIHTLRGAPELRTKESDRISAMASMLKASNIMYTEFDDGLEISGGTARSFTVDAVHDHRIAMAAAVLAVRAQVSATIYGADVANISFPEFFKSLESMGIAELDWT